MKVYKLKINYHNSYGDFIKGAYFIADLLKNRYVSDKNKEAYFSAEYVEKNPDIFEECTREWLLKEAAKRYPVGTQFSTLNDNKTVTSQGRLLYYSINTGKDLKITITCSILYTEWTGYISNPTIYCDGKWAEIVKEPLFTTEDGVNIYKGDKYYLVNNNIYVCNIANKNCGTKQFKYFSTKEKAQEYIDLNKPKYSKQDIIDAVMNVYIMEGMSQNVKDQIIKELDKDV